MPTAIAEASTAGEWHHFSVLAIIIAATLGAKAITTPLATHDLHDIVHDTGSYR